MKHHPVGLAFFFIALLLFFACQNKPGRIGMPRNFIRVIPDTVTIVSYNVENLFDMVDNGDEYPEYKPNEHNWTNNTYHLKLDNIASVLAAINPDIAVLVEIENENAVQGLCAALAVKKCAYPYYALGGQAIKGSVMPVVLSKFPVLSETSFGVTTGAPLHDRNMLEARIYLGRDTLTVFACHWPSKTHRESARLANAKLLAERLAEVPRGKDYIVAGDFNEDYDECETFHTLGFDDTRGVTGINHVLKTVRSPPQRYVEFEKARDLATDTAHAHYDPWLDVPQARRFTTVFKGRPETPDHIFLPASMFDTAGISYVNNSFSPFTWNGRLLKDGAPYRWQMRYTRLGAYHTGEGFSDHLPLVARLCRCAYKPETGDTSGQSQQVPTGALGGFEDGMDGWVSGVKQVGVVRDTVAPHSGAYCLAIYGRAGSNASAARCRLARPSSCGTHQASLRLWVRGKGSMCFRSKPSDASRWTYFKGEDFTPTKGGNYTDYVFEKWTSISLPLAFAPGSEKEIDVEIRTKKDKEVRLFVDDVKIVCNK
jgi:endonuclease/exonuclease/phosphatase family metal-dependent hydrolase